MWPEFHDGGERPASTWRWGRDIGGKLELGAWRSRVVLLGSVDPASAGQQERDDGPEPQTAAAK